jgi:DNA-binding transcriptional MerR regulator
MSLVMYTIGEFASFGRLSVRMLRHYDSIGLLVPARVDPHSAYRYYSNDQLASLLRIVELRGLGVGLEAIRAVLESGDERTAYVAALESRREEIEQQISADAAHLARIEARLRHLEGTAMATPVTYRALEPVTVYAVSGNAPGMGPELVGPTVGPLIGALDAALEAAGRPMIEPGIFWYEPLEETEELKVSVSYIAENPPVPGAGYDVVELPAIELAATLIHKGDMSGIGDSWMALTEQLLADGYRIAGSSREVYLVADGHEPGPHWETELQMPVERVN